MRTTKLEELLRFSVNFFPVILICTLALTAVLGFFALKLGIVADVESLILNDDNPEGFSDKAFLNSDYLMIAVEGEDLYTPATMKRLSIFIDEVSSLDKIAQPISPFNQYTFEKNGRQLKIVQFSPSGGVPATDAEIETFRERLLADPLVRGLLVSSDGKVLCLLFPYRPMDDYSGFMKKLEPSIHRLEEEVHVYVSGPIPFEQAIKERLIGDFSRLIILSLVVILLLLYVGFRSLWITLLPLLTVIIGTIWTLGLMSVFNIPISVISVMTPPLVLTLGTSYTIHILNQYFRDTGHGKEGGATITSSVFSVGRTIVLASLTTIIGFSSLLITRLPQTREFGIATSFGILSCALLSIFILPGLLSRIRRPSDKQHDIVMEGKIVRLLDAAGRLAQRRKRWFAGFLIILLIGFGFAIPGIEYDSNYLEYFSKKEQVIQDFYFIAEHLSGINQIHMVFEGPQEEEGFFLRPEVLRAIVEFEDSLRSEPCITHILSFPGYIREMNNTMTGAYEIPTSRGLILLLARYFTVLSRRDPANSMLGVMANENFTRLVGSFRTFDRKDGSFVSEQEMSDIMSRTEAAAERILPPDITVRFSGGSLRYKSLYEKTRTDQVRSTLLALSLIFIVTTVFFRSLRFGALTLLPMVTGITSMYIFMALTGIPLDMTTLMVSSVVIGIGVDDSIHFLLRYRKQLSKTSDRAEAIRNTLHITGRPIVLTSVSIIGGILVLTLSSFTPILYFSLLVSFTLLATTLGCIFILPALLSLEKTTHPTYP